jgi:hypothetical protein
MGELFDDAVPKAFPGAAERSDDVTAGSLRPVPSSTASLPAVHLGGGPSVTSPDGVNLNVHVTVTLNAASPNANGPVPPDSPNDEAVSPTGENILSSIHPVFCLNHGYEWERYFLSARLVHRL